MRRAVLILGLSVSLSAWAQNGVWLTSVCAGAVEVRKNPHNTDMYFEAGACFGTVKALKDQLTSVVSPSPGMARLCPRNGATIRDDEAVWYVWDYLHKHPERHHLPSTQLAIEALQRSFPCPHP